MADCPTSYWHIHLARVIFSLELETQGIIKLQTNLIGNIDSLLEVASGIAAIIFGLYALTNFVIALFRRGPVFALLRLFSFQVIIPFLFTVGVYLTSLAVVFVDPTNVGVVVSLASPGGIRPAPITSGLHLVIPLLEEVIEYPIYWQNYTMSATFEEGAVLGDDSIRVRTSDGQEVRLDVTAIFRIDVNQAVQVHINWQNRYVEEFVRPSLAGLVRQEAARFTVDEVNSDSRVALQAAISRLLLVEFRDQGLTLDQFLLRDINFSPEYAEAVELKQVALEEIEQARFVGLAAESEARGVANAIEIEAQAEANALLLIAAALQDNPDLLTYTYIERLAPNIRALLLPSNNPLLLPLPELEEVLTDPEPAAEVTPVPTAASQ